MRRLKVNITGPLADYLPGLWTYLLTQGYTPLTIRNVARLMAHLSRWMEQRKLSPSELESDTIDKFLRHRKRSRYTKFLSRPSIEAMVCYLQQSGIVALFKEAPERNQNQLEVSLREYRSYLDHERSLTQGVIWQYTQVAREFLEANGKGDVSRLRSLAGADVSAFLLKAARSSNTSKGKTTVSALRSLLRYQFLRGDISTDLAKAVLGVASSRYASLPKALTPEAVKSLLRGCDRRTHEGRRSFAAILLMVRLGLRAGEITALELDDIHWRQGEIIIKGKGKRRDRLPLPEDVGQALASYIRWNRSSVATRKVFLRRRAPHRGLSAVGIFHIVRRACLRAGIPPIGPHRLRHTTATEMLRHGAPLSEIAQVLRHSSIDTTAIYAKVDRASLRALVQPWPGGAL